ncbi:22080_t:CDS:2, partial [Entrophospora sp. SA101]
ASVHRKQKFDPSLQGRKADFSVYIPIRGENFYLLVSETRSADYILLNKITLESCDMMKMGNEMKDVIDKCIDNGDASTMCRAAQVRKNWRNYVDGNGFTWKKCLLED